KKYLRTVFRMKKDVNPTCCGMALMDIFDGETGWRGQERHRCLSSRPAPRHFDRSAPGAGRATARSAPPASRGGRRCFRWHEGLPTPVTARDSGCVRKAADEPSGEPIR